MTRPDDGAATTLRPTPERVWLLVSVTVVALVVHVWALYRSPSFVGPPAFPGLDKVQHAVGFAVPLLLVLLCLSTLTTARRTWAGVAVAGFAAHAVVSEVVQARFVPGRTGDPLDVLADLVGVAAAVAAYVVLDRRSS